MSEAEEERRVAAKQQVERDLERLEARTPGDSFWGSLRLLGSVGWPIALLTLVGAGVGRALGSGWLTAALIALGALVGSLVALSGLPGGKA